MCYDDIFCWSTFYSFYERNNSHTKKKDIILWNTIRSLILSQRGGLHCKKRLMIFPSGFHQPNSLWTGIIKLFPATESLVSDIPAGDGKIDNLFYSVGL